MPLTPAPLLCAATVALLFLPVSIAGAQEGSGAAEPVPDAPLRYATGTPAHATAWQIAVERWGMQPCAGDVRVTWEELPAGVNATSSWANDVSAYGAPERNTACSIVWNTAAPFSWRMFCTIMVHEVGHLAGHAHSDDPDDVMAPYYAVEDPRCASTPDPSGFLPRGRGGTSSTVRTVRARTGRARTARTRGRHARR